jgi:hypothetical protein
MNRTFVSYVAAHMWAAVALVTAALSTTIVLAQSPAAGQNDMAAHQQMMAERKAAMAKMAAADQKLTALVARMNTAKGEEKVTALAAVVNELVAQRTEMREQMRMQGGMMERMMSHMSGMHGTGGMMNKAPTPDKAAEPDHGAHHPEK